MHGIPTPTIDVSAFHLLGSASTSGAALGTMLHLAKAGTARFVLPQIQEGCRRNAALFERIGARGKFERFAHAVQTLGPNETADFRIIKHALFDDVRPALSRALFRVAHETSQIQDRKSLLFDIHPAFYPAMLFGAYAGGIIEKQAMVSLSFSLSHYLTTRLDRAHALCDDMKTVSMFARSGMTFSIIGISGVIANALMPPTSTIPFIVSAAMGLGLSGIGPIFEQVVSHNPLSHFVLYALMGSGVLCMRNRLVAFFKLGMPSYALLEEALERDRRNIEHYRRLLAWADTSLPPTEEHCRNLFGPSPSV